MDIEENIPLSTLTTFRTGGPARFLLSVHDEADIIHAVSFAKKENLPLIPLGDGSNLCAPDSGVLAAFVRLSMKELTVAITGTEVTISADAGLSWDSLVDRTVSEGWWGLENLSGIPGTVGASVVQNIGAYGAAVSECIASVRAFDTTTMAMRTFAPAECGFGYRTSIFKKETDRYLVTTITLVLSASARPNITYRDLAKRFQGGTSPLRAIRDAVIDIRKGKFPPLSAFGTAGSFFLNPIVSEAERSVLAARYPEMPFFALPEGGVKVPLAWLFDKVLSVKGMREGKAFLWEKQPLVIAAEFGARSEDVYALAAHVARLLREKTGINISPEVRLFVPFPQNGIAEHDARLSRA